VSDLRPACYSPLSIEKTERRRIVQMSDLCRSLELLAGSELPRERRACELRRMPLLRLSEKGCDFRSGREFGPSIGAKTGRTGRFGRLVAPPFGYLWDFSDSLSEHSGG
jgi:hypothetical protein